MTDAQHMVAVEHDGLNPAPARLDEGAVGGADVLGDERARFVAANEEMLCRDIRVVDYDVVVIAAADAHLARREAVARGDVAMAPQHLDPDHFVHCTASRKCLARLTALS